MHEERLSPGVGRLIDAAKAAATKLEPARAGTEVVGVLMSTGAIYTAVAGEEPAAPAACAAESALALAHAEGDGEILAAVVTLAHEPSDSVLPSPGSRRSLAALDPELPVVIKQRGRWVILPLSRLDSSV